MWLTAQLFKMDIQQDFEIQQYLNHDKYPDQVQSNQEKKKFVNMTKYFMIQNANLYRYDRRRVGHLLQVLKWYELEPILYMMHNDPTAGHFGIEIMFNKLRIRYYWPQMYEDIKAYVKACDSYQRQGGLSKNNKLYPIPLHSLFYQIGIDFIGPLPIILQGNRYIIIVVNIFTK